MNWVDKLPNFYIINSRQEIDFLWKKKSPPWCIMWAAEDKNIYLLARDKYATESNHEPDSDELYRCRIKHELAYQFIDEFIDLNCVKKAKRMAYPLWLHDGLSDVLSGGTLLKERPKSIKGILGTYDVYSDDNCEYKESLFVVKALLKKYGKEKILELLKKAAAVGTNMEFKKIFREVYGFTLNYKNINDLVYNE